LALAVGDNMVTLGADIAGVVAAITESDLGAVGEKTYTASLC
jgi:hypothetical protein